MHSPIIICNYYEQIILYSEQRGGATPPEITEFLMYNNEMTASECNSRYGTQVPTSPLTPYMEPYMVGPGGIMWYSLYNGKKSCQIGITDNPEVWDSNYGASDYNELRLEMVVGDHVGIDQLLATLETNATGIELLAPIYNATISSINYPDGSELSKDDCYTTPIFTFDAGFR
jgi:hypothetical protein